MKHRIMTIPTIVAMILFLYNCTAQDKFPELEGPYFGQKPPGRTAELFAPGIISTGLNEGNICFSPDGKELYYFFSTPEGPFRGCFIFYSRLENSFWTEPEEFPFIKDRNSGYQFVSPDGQKIYFDKHKDNSIWCICYIEKINGEWTAPKAIDFGRDGIVKDSSYPSVAANGNLYYYLDTRDETNIADIYMAKYENGKYLKPKRLSNAVNTPNYQECHPYIAPDESYIIFDSNRPENSFGKDDLYISFRDQNGKWMEAQNLGERVNTKYGDKRPFVTFDGKYLFFASFRTEISKLPNKLMTLNELHKLVNGSMNGSSDFYWIDAKIIEELKPDKLK